MGASQVRPRIDQMQVTKKHHSVVLFYNSVLIFFLLTLWLTKSLFQLTSLFIALLFIPVGFYFVLLLTNTFVNFTEYLHIKNTILGRVHYWVSLYSLILVCVFFFALLININRPTEFLFNLAILPLPAYLFYRHWLRAKSKLKNYTRLTKLLSKSFAKKAEVDVVTQVAEAKTTEYMSEDEAAGKSAILSGIKDVDRRQFLKLIGGTSLGFAVLSLVMPQKASAAFFGSVPGPGTVALKNSDGNQINPSEKSPTDGYNISEIDDDGLPSYYGFVDKDGNWYISQENSTGSYRYAKGASAFVSNWGNRTSLSYDYFDVVFS